MIAKQVIINHFQGKEIIRVENMNISTNSDRFGIKELNIYTETKTIVICFSDIRFVSISGDLIHFFGYTAEKYKTVKSGTRVDIYIRF